MTSFRSGYTSCISGFCGVKNTKKSQTVTVTSSAEGITVAGWLCSFVWAAFVLKYLPLRKINRDEEPCLHTSCATDRKIQQRSHRSRTMTKITSQVMIKVFYQMFLSVAMPKEIQYLIKVPISHLGYFSKYCNSWALETCNVFNLSSIIPWCLGKMQTDLETHEQSVLLWQSEKLGWQNSPVVIATGEVVQEFLCFSPFELAFGHTLCGSLIVVKQILHL